MTTDPEMTTWNVYLKETGKLIGRIEYTGRRSSGAKVIAAAKFDIPFNSIRVEKVNYHGL